ncbi:MAG TPA: putative oxidoreductase C-terminal domain-containing protein, partial [Candidatus Glassbacteria bacterium]|nr:putative oxidoreductase C-terminal domain-containing protein [Candidatus Glassbacteria bacterium]
PGVSMKRAASIFRLLTATLASAAITAGCTQAPAPQPEQPVAAREHSIAVLDPGHFHAALVFKPASYQGVSSLVNIYAPVGDDFVDHLARVIPFNTRPDNPAAWRYRISLGPDCEQEMLEEKAGDIAVLSGRNQPKIDRILACVKAGFNVLADKPWVIDPAKLPVLEEVIAQAKVSGKVAYDIMTERCEITTILQREIIQDQATFGAVVEGTPEDPGVVKESVHYLYKLVAGRPNKRPWWFFDTSIQGEGIVDVTTHLVDIIFWVLWPEQPIEHGRDIEMVSARHWSTPINREQFEKITTLPDFPAELALNRDGKLDYFCNGRMNFKVKGVNCAVQVVWNFEAPEGSGDTHYSVIRGTKAHVLVLQGKEQNYRPELYVEPAPGAERSAVGKALNDLVARLNQSQYPGVSLAEEGQRWRIEIPESYRIGHEAHFGQVAQRFLDYLDKGHLPEWEYANLLSKYYVTTGALALCRQ